jgi:hypothetical protein
MILSFDRDSLVKTTVGHPYFWYSVSSQYRFTRVHGNGDIIDEDDNWCKEVAYIYPNHLTVEIICGEMEQKTVWGYRE